MTDATTSIIAGGRPVPAKKARGGKRVRRTSVFRTIGVVLLMVWTLVPIYWAVNLSLQSGAQIASKPSNYVPPTPTTSAYSKLLLGSGQTATSIRASIVNIIIECGAATIITVILSTLAAYAFARMRFRGKKIVFFGVLATMAFPAYTTLIPLYRMMSAVGLVNTYLGIVLVYVSGFLPLATWILHNYMSSLPVSLEEACAMDGASRMQVLWHVVLPLTLPGIVSTALITFLSAWGQFLFPLVLSTDISTQPLTVIVSTLQGRHTVPVNLLSAAGVVAIVVPAAIALFLNKYIVSGLLAGSVK